MIEYDVETVGLQWYSGELFLVQFYDGETLDILHHPRDKSLIQEWLNKDDDFRAYNTKFDYHFLAQAGYSMPPWDRMHDGLVMVQIIDFWKKSGLKDRANKLIGPESVIPAKELRGWLTKERARRKKELGKGSFEEPTYKDVPMELMKPYAAADVLYTKQVCDHYAEELSSNSKLQDIYWMEQRLMGILYEIEKRGIPVDVEGVYQLHDSVESNVNNLREACLRLSKKPDINLNSYKQIYEVLVDRGVTDFEYTEKGNPRVNEAALKRINDEFTQTLLKLKKEQKLLGTYIKPLIEKTWDSDIRSFKDPFIKEGRIHPNFRQVGAVTGRMSCADPNVQNWPARKDLRFRYLLKASPGKVLIACDLDAIEMALFGAFVGKGTVLEAVQNGHDIHQMTASLLGLPSRYDGKLWNFSILYGAGIPRLSSQFGFTTKEAARARSRYFGAFPEVKDFIDTVKREVNKNGYVESLWGRRYKLNPDGADYVYANYKVQGTAADLFKASVIKMGERSIPIISLIHDEVLAEEDEDKAHETAKIMQRCLTDHPRVAKLVPLSAEIDIIKRWSDAKEPGYVPEYMHAAV